MTKPEPAGWWCKKSAKGCELCNGGRLEFDGILNAPKDILKDHELAYLRTQVRQAWEEFAGWCDKTIKDSIRLEFTGAMEGLFIAREEARRRAKEF